MHRFSILLIDDDEQFAMTLAERLALRGAITRHLESSDDILHEIEMFRPNVLVLTLSKQPLESLDLLRKVKAAFPLLGIICLTTMSGNEENCRRIGIRNVINKPFPIEVLVQALEDLI